MAAYFSIAGLCLTFDRPVGTVLQTVPGNKQEWKKMSRSLLQPIRPLFILFILINAIALTGKSMLEKYHFSQELLILGNLLLFVVVLVSYIITYRSLHSANSQAFIRAMYGSFLIKFFFLAIAAFVYIMMAKKEVNKPGLGVCALLYIVYTGIEIRALMKTLKDMKQKTHG